MTTLAAIAAALNVGKNSPGRWKSYPDFPTNPDGTYPVGKIARWVEAMRSRANDRGPDVASRPLSAERAAADLTFRNLKSERERLTIEKERGGLLSREEIEERSAELLADLRRNLLVILPRRLAPRSAKQQALIKAEVRLFLEAWSK